MTDKRSASSYQVVSKDQPSARTWDLERYRVATSRLVSARDFLAGFYLLFATLLPTLGTLCRSVREKAYKAGKVQVKKGIR